MKKSIISLLFFFVVCAFAPNIVFAQASIPITMGIDAHSLDFGKVIVGTTKSLPFRISNATGMPTKLLISWSPIIQPFSINPAITIYELQMSNQKEFTITFKPTVAISYNQTLTLTNNANRVEEYSSPYHFYPNGYPQFIIHFIGIGIGSAVVNPRQIQEKTQL